MPENISDALRWSSTKIKTIRNIGTDLNLMFRFKQKIMILKLATHKDLSSFDDK